MSGSDYPAGALEDPRAPFNEDEMSKQEAQDEYESFKEDSKDGPFNTDNESTS